MSIDEILPLIGVILVIYIGIPLFILWLKDRRNLLGLIIKRIFGAISLLFGLTLLGWILYNLVSPTPEFRASIHVIHGFGFIGAILTGFSFIGRGVVVFGMIVVGWRWLTERRSTSEQEKERMEEEISQEKADGEE